MIAQKTESAAALSPSDRLIVALDVETERAARQAVSELDGLVTGFKVGLQLFTAAGPGFVKDLAAAGKRVFLDLKFHDIPNTVARAGVEAAKLGVWMFNVHASGGGEMMKAVRAEVESFCAGRGNRRPIITAVTVLTSSDFDTLNEIGVLPDVNEQVSRLARLTAESGLDGVVASANEANLVRECVDIPGFLIVTPGIRPENATNADQKRVMTPGAAISTGADHLVVGRPILEAANRADAAAKILDEIGKAF